MAKLYGLAFHLFCVLVSLPRFIDAEPTYLPEAPTTPPNPPAPPAETPDVHGDPPIAFPDGIMIPVDECKDPRPYDSPCAYCWCYSGEWVCAIMDCAMPQCPNAYTEPGQCCPTCPNGPSCEIDGQIVPLGETVQVADGECTCQNENDFWGPPQVACRPKPPSCTDSTMEVTCGYCFCDESSGGWVCLDRSCYPPFCVDVVKSQDGCCDECPNGYNCEAYGEIIPWGEVKTLFNGLECACEFSWEWSSSSPLKAQCYYVPQPPAPITDFIVDNPSELPPEKISESAPEGPAVVGK